MGKNMIDYELDPDGDPVVHAEQSAIRGLGDPTKIAIRFDPTFERMIGRAVHGNTPFDVPYISEIAPNLWQGGCKSGLILPSNIKHLVSLYPWERYTMLDVIDSEMYVKMYDSNEGVNAEQVWQIAQHVSWARSQGPTLVHCQAGLNRSSLVAAASLIIDGYEPDAAISLIRMTRSPACLCNPTFEAWLQEAA